MKEVMKDGENEKTEEEQAKSTNEVGKNVPHLMRCNSIFKFNL